jgi:two-component system cell cycle sensor histidine kinase/response regulator CckA
VNGLAYNQAQDGPAEDSETILLVEDEPAVRGLFAQALRQAGYQVIEARNGAEALQVFDRIEGKIDLLLTDIRMPFLGGTELAGQLLARRPELRLLYISGYAAKVELGPNAALLQKPFVRADLLRAVRNVIDRPLTGGAAVSAQEQNGGNRPEGERQA